jgi:hypothetical protein
MSPLGYKPRKKTIRRFIYLDTETLNSYIAPIYNGLIKTNEEKE